MPAKLARGLITTKDKYVCLYCRLQSSPLARGQTRYQHTGPPANVGGDTDQGSTPKDLEYNDSTSRSHVGDVIRNFMFKLDEKDKEPKGASSNESREQSPPALQSLLSIAPQSKDSTDAGQRKLQQKFAAQRRKDMLDMQVSEALRTAEEIMDVPKVRSVPKPTQQSPEESSTQAERSEAKRKSEKAVPGKTAKKPSRPVRKKAIQILKQALAEPVDSASGKKAKEQSKQAMAQLIDSVPGKSAIKRSQRSKRRQAESVDIAQNEVAEGTTPTQPQTAQESPTGIEASIGKTEETSRAEGKEANGNASAGNASGRQSAIAQKLDEIMDILKPSKDPKKPAKSAEKAYGMEKISTDTRLERVVASIFNALQNSGGSPATTPKADARIVHFGSKLLAPLTEKSDDHSRSLDQSKLQILLKTAVRKDNLRGRRIRKLRVRKISNSLVRRISSDSPLTPSNSAFTFRRPALRQKTLRQKSVRPKPVRQKTMKVTKYRSSDSSGFVPAFQSLRDALTQESGRVRGTDLESLQLSPSEKIENASVPPKAPKGRVRTARAPPKAPKGKVRKVRAAPNSFIETANASDLEILPVTVEQPPVPRLAYGLERVLFNPGVYQLQDPRSRVYNFDPYLQKIMPVAEFDFNALKEYITSSRDESLKKIAKEHGKRYMGSTSSMTQVLAQFHFLLSQWRPINTSMLSKAFPANMTSFTELQRTPSAIFLRWKNGSYAIDADKQFDSASVLSFLGKSMEKLLTSSTNDFERYRISSPGRVTEDERCAPESYHYSTLGDFLMRSQLDAHDPRLPGTGMFDLKTRSVVSIRMDIANYEHGIGYEIKSRQGEWESYEREYYDMIRAAFLKYSMQVRMGRMDGIFVAFHNIERIFGFQYISLPEMDFTIHGQRDASMGDQEFKLSLDLMNKVLDRATEKYPGTSLRIFFETREARTPFMYVFAEPVTEEQVAEIQSRNSAQVQEFERKVLNLTRGNGSETNHAQEVDPNWEKIQADVQEAMEKDELSVDESGLGQEALDEDAEGSRVTPIRPEVFEHGPLYASKNAAGTDDDATAISAGNEEAEGDGEGEDETNGEDECEDEDGTVENTAVLSDNYPGESKPNANLSGEEHNEDDTPGAAGSQAGTSATSSPPGDILALTLTVRNIVNGEHVLRPERMSEADDWSIEYSLTEIESQKRARALYKACQVRRGKKLEPEALPEDTNLVNGYVRYLRNLSIKGRRWRKQQDRMDSERPVQVLSNQG